MKIKALIVTVAILAVLSVVAFLARRPDAPPSAEARIGQSLVDNSRIESAKKIRLTDQGKSVTLQREPDSAWSVGNYHGLPADFSKLSQFASSLAAGKTSRLVSTRPDVISRLEFKDTRIELLDASDKTLWSVTLGKRTDTGDRYVRFDDESKGYLANINTWIDAEPKNWANTQLLSLEHEEIASVEIPLAEGNPVSITRPKKEDTWTVAKTPEGQRLKADRISSLLSSLVSLRFTETHDPADEKFAAARAHARTWKLTKFDGKTISVTLARVPETKKIKAPATTEAVPDFTKNLPADKDVNVKPIETPNLTVPEFETVPAGPVFAFVSSSDEAAPVNGMMKKRAFEIAEHVFTSLPQKADELFEPAPAPAPATTSAPSERPQPADEKPNDTKTK